MNRDTFLFIVIAILCVTTCIVWGRRLFSKKEGMTTTSAGSATVYTAPNGSTAVISGNGTIVVKSSDGATTVYTANEPTSDTYYGPNGGSATVKHADDGSGQVTAISVVGPQGGDAIVFSAQNVAEERSGTTAVKGTTAGGATYDNYNHYTGVSYPTVFYGPDGGTARVVQTGGDQTLVITNKNGKTEIYNLQTGGSTSNATVTTYVGANGATAVVAQGTDGKYTVSVTTANGDKVVYHEDNVYTYQDAGGDFAPTADEVNNYNTTTTSTQQSAAYMATLPAGIPRSQIPAGQEDLYILKSEIVPPVCPACPTVICPEPEPFDQSKCGPCPPCARVRTDDFECKKVPNYKAAAQSDILPVPVVSDFSGFGM